MQETGPNKKLSPGAEALMNAINSKELNTEEILREKETITAQPDDYAELAVMQHNKVFEKYFGVPYDENHWFELKDQKDNNPDAKSCLNRMSEFMNLFPN